MWIGYVTRTVQCVSVKRLYYTTAASAVAIRDGFAVGVTRSSLLVSV